MTRTTRMQPRRLGAATGEPFPTRIIGKADE